MSLFHLHILTTSQIAALKAGGHEVEAFALTEAQKAVLALKATDVGATVAKAITDVASKDMTGPAKFEAVLADTLPLILKYAMGGGTSAAIADVEDIGRALVQSVFNDVKSSTAGKIATQILHALGIG